MTPTISTPKGRVINRGVNMNEVQDRQAANTISMRLRSR